MNKDEKPGAKLVRNTRGLYPLDAMNVALMKMTHAQRMKASPEKAAAKYGVQLDWARYYIEHWRTVHD